MARRRAGRRPAAGTAGTVPAQDVHASTRAKASSLKGWPAAHARVVVQIAALHCERCMHRVLGIGSTGEPLWPATALGTGCVCSGLRHLGPIWRIRHGTLICLLLLDAPAGQVNWVVSMLLGGPSTCAFVQTCHTPAGSSCVLVDCCGGAGASTHAMVGLHQQHQHPCCLPRDI